jgi:hypothetical protein
MLPVSTVQKLPSLLLCAALAATSGCYQPQPANEQAEQNAAQQTSSNLAAEVPLPQPAMDRAALLQAVALARSATAAGVDDSQAQRALDGKQFEVRIRFGCAGAAAKLEDATLGWTYNADKRVLRISATPTLNGDDPLVAQLNAKDIEAVEGFWIPRPWMLKAACPAPPVAPVQSEPERRIRISEKDVSQPQTVAPPSPPAAKIGIAQFFTAADPRTTRRDHRPYAATKTLEAGTPQVGVTGFDLVLEGRLRPGPGGRVILCKSEAVDRPPDCMVSARIDRVRFEQPDTGETIAEWGSS